MVLLVSVGLLVHKLLLVSTQYTWSELLSVLVVYVLLLLPTVLPFNFHWYVGFAPAFVVLAVKVTVLLAHILELGVAIFIVAFTIGLTITTILSVAIQVLPLDTVRV